MGVKNADLADLIEITLADLPKQQFEVMWDHPQYEFCRIYQNERMEIDGGTSIKRKVMLDPAGGAHYRRLFDTDEPDVEDVMQGIDVPWTQISTNYSWDKVEILRNKNTEKGFINLMKTRRVAKLWGLADLIEERAWKTPTSATDDLYPYGVPYYLTFYESDSTISTTDGFNGQFIKFQDGTYSATVAGLNATTYDKWRNYCAVYSNIDNAMLKKFRKAFLLTKFKAPLIVNDPANKRNAAKRIYCDADTAVELQDLADQRDDKHTGGELMGNIFADPGGVVYINRLPVIYIPQLVGATANPIYCVDFSKFIPVVQEGYWMVEGEPMVDRSQHTTFTVFLDGSHQNLCVNRRAAGFVLHKSA